MEVKESASGAASLSWQKRPLPIIVVRNVPKEVINTG